MRYVVIDLWELTMTSVGAMVVFVASWYILKRWFFYTTEEEQLKVYWENKR